MRGVGEGGRGGELGKAPGSAWRQRLAAAAACMQQPASQLRRTLVERRYLGGVELQLLAGVDRDEHWARVGVDLVPCVPELQVVQDAGLVEVRQLREVLDAILDLRVGIGCLLERHSQLLAVVQLDGGLLVIDRQYHGCGPGLLVCPAPDLGALLHAAVVFLHGDGWWVCCSVVSSSRYCCKGLMKAAELAAELPAELAASERSAGEAGRGGLRYMGAGG